jgi:ribonuclease Y
MNEALLVVLTFLISVAGAIPAGIVIRKKTAESKIKSAESEVNRILENAGKEAENIKKEKLLQAQEELLQKRNELDKEIRERRDDVQLKEKRAIQKEETLDRRLDNIERKEKETERRVQELDSKKKNLEEVFKQQMTRLQELSGLSREEAKIVLLEELDKTLTDEKALLIKESENKLKEESAKNAREILSYAIQKCAADHTSETTVSVVALPNDDMKGRIIGREGRNIKALETLTGIDLIIDDTPEAVILSGFDPLRREVAKIALEKLIDDRQNTSRQNRRNGGKS